MKFDWGAAAITVGAFLGTLCFMVGLIVITSLLLGQIGSTAMIVILLVVLAVGLGAFAGFIMGDEK